MGVRKYSRQRESIKNYLSQTTQHPNADTVYAHVKKEYPNISLGTVYRNLNLLVDIGEAMKITTLDGIIRFDGNAEPHYHFVCSACKNVMDLEMENIDHINEVASENFGGHIQAHIATFYGHCGDCVRLRAPNRNIY